MTDTDLRHFGGQTEIRVDDLRRAQALVIGMDDKG